MSETYGFPTTIWYGVLIVLVIGGLGYFAFGWRNGLRARPVSGRVVRVTHRSAAAGHVQSVMAEVAVTDPPGRATMVLTFPTGATGGVWEGRELTLWQRPDGGKPPRLLRPGRSLRGLILAGSAFTVLAGLVGLRITHTDPNTIAALKPAGVVVAAASAVVAVVQLGLLLKTQRILRGTAASGRVLGLVRHVSTDQDGSSKVTYQPIVGFTTADGTQVLGQATTSGTRRRKWTGRPVEIRHVPGHPETFRLAKPSELWVPLSSFLFSAVFVIAGLVAVGFGIRG